MPAPGQPSTPWRSRKGNAWTAPPQKKTNDKQSKGLEPKPRKGRNHMQRPYQCAARGPR